MKSTVQRVIIIEQMWTLLHLFPTFQDPGRPCCLSASAFISGLFFFPLYGPWATLLQRSRITRDRDSLFVYTRPWSLYILAYRWLCTEAEIWRIVIRSGSLERRKYFDLLARSSVQHPFEIEDNRSERLIGYLIQSPVVYAEFWHTWARQNLIDNLFSKPLIPRCFKG